MANVKHGNKTKMIKMGLEKAKATGTEFDMKKYASKNAFRVNCTSEMLYNVACVVINPLRKAGVVETIRPNVVKFTTVQNSAVNTTQPVVVVPTVTNLN